MINFYYFVKHPASTLVYNIPDTGVTQMKTHFIPLKCSKSDRDTHTKTEEFNKMRDAKVRQ